MQSIQLYDKTVSESGGMLHYGGCSYDVLEFDGIRPSIRDLRAKGFAIYRHRVLYLTKNGKNKLKFDCSYYTVESENDVLSRMLSFLQATVIKPVARQRVEELFKTGTITIAGVELTAFGTKIDGSWKFLAWRAPQQKVPWGELEVVFDGDDVIVRSLVEPQKTMMVDIFDLHDSLVLDAVLRLLLVDGSFGKIPPTRNSSQ